MLSQWMDYRSPPFSCHIPYMAGRPSIHPCVSYHTIGTVRLPCVVLPLDSMAYKAYQLASGPMSLLCPTYRHTTIIPCLLQYMRRDTIQYPDTDKGQHHSYDASPNNMYYPSLYHTSHMTRIYNNNNRTSITGPLTHPVPEPMALDHRVVHALLPVQSPLQ